MPDQPPFLPQQSKYSCAVACLRMLLAAHGIDRTEEELRILCDCGTEGTGERKIPIAEFEEDWQLMRGLTILCQK